MGESPNAMLVSSNCPSLWAAAKTLRRFAPHICRGTLGTPFNKSFFSPRGKNWGLLSQVPYFNSRLNIILAKWVPVPNSKTVKWHVESVFLVWLQGKQGSLVLEVCAASPSPVIPSQTATWCSNLETLVQVPLSSACSMVVWGSQDHRFRNLFLLRLWFHQQLQLL